MLPLPLMPAAERYLAPAESAELSWERVKARNWPIAACWPAIMMPIPASPAPAAIASAPSTMVAMLIPVASLLPSWMRIEWPPATWPSSCAITPCSWLTLSGGEEQPGLDIDRLAGGDEGVDLGIVEQDDVGRFGVEARGLDQRRARCP